MGEGSFNNQTSHIYLAGARYCNGDPRFSKVHLGSDARHSGSSLPEGKGEGSFNSQTSHVYPEGAQ